MKSPVLSPLDHLISQADRALRTLSPGNATRQRPSPAQTAPHTELTDAEKRHAAGLMRINHAGEVCAQALYQGQALTAKLPEVKQEMEKAASEETDHLVWCEERLAQLDSRASVFNPLWYGMSFGIGAAAGLVGDKVSLGFVAATEDQVCKHLEDHLQELPAADQKSRSIVEQMLSDEAQHAKVAIDAGGLRFPAPLKAAMSLVSRVMTKSSYRL